MIDRPARDELYRALKKAALGKMSAFDCENVALSLDCKDRGIAALCRTLRKIVDEDNRSLKPIFARTTVMRRRLARWLLFLKTNAEYEWPNERLPPGILDFYRPTLIDRLIGIKARTERRIGVFKQAGDYEAWPFISKQSLDEARRVGVLRRGLRLGGSLRGQQHQTESRVISGVSSTRPDQE